MKMQNILISLDKTTVQKLRRQLDILTREANTVNTERSIMEIKSCQKLLYKAMGMLQAMEQLELLSKDDTIFINEDQERINNKIINILEEKRKASRVLQHK
jgi:hypothetical protein